MLKRLFFPFILIGLCSSFAQTYIHKDINSSNRIGKIEKLNEIRILAVMVEFQPDDFELTYGDGTFGTIYSEDYGTNIIDPLPHDKNYFEDHLDFAVNYYQKVSDNKVTVTYNVLPDIYTVSKPMRDYSPIEGESFKVLADFSSEVWSLVANANAGLDYSEYNTFVIFHAGVGKDISTSDLFGEARDLPSVFLGLNSLKEFYGDSFNGFEVGQNQFIENTLILPETESREETGIGGTTLIELSINGLIVSSIASRMGLPDLFDAETGKSAIGRFGLMDGQSLFAYAGLFPPEPSAWEKIYLGWEEPILVDKSAEDIVVTAARASGSSDNKIVKVPINSSEYYLIENRNRDVNADGITLTYKVAGEIRTINFSEDLDNFNNSFVDTMRGVVLDVDEFDWALPGNGILIWHIDENIINENLSSNRVNVGSKRGVDLEEADGIQDIGEEFQTIFGDIIIAEGDEFDLWYSGNTSDLYSNEFGISTKPSTRSNSGANSLIKFSGFSEIGSQMSFDLNIGTESVSLIRSFNVDPQINPAHLKLTSLNEDVTSYFLGDDQLYLFTDSLFIAEDFSTNGFSVAERESGRTVFGATDNNLNIASFDTNELSIFSVLLEADITSPVAVDIISNTDFEIYAGLENGNIQSFTYNELTSDIGGPNQTIELFTTPIEQIVFDSGNIFAFSGNNLSFLGEIIQLAASIKSFVITQDLIGDYIAIILCEDNSIYSYQTEFPEPRFLFTSQEEIESIALADLKNDGNNYITFYLSNKIYALNLNGNIADNFPVNIFNGETIVGALSIADVNNDLQYDIVSVSDKGNIYAFSGGNGELLNGFPLSTGGSVAGNFALSGYDNSIYLSASTMGGNFFTWRLLNTGNVAWTNISGNNYSNAFLESASNEKYISEYFPLNRTYNWPNPVYGNETHIRTYVSEDSNVDVKVFDIAGDLVDEFQFFASGGLDTEHLWNVKNVQSGAYFARVEVKSNSGKSETKIIKIAVVK